MTRAVRVIPCPPNVDPAVHAELVVRHWRLASPERPVRRFGERRVVERRVEPPGMAGVPGLDRRRGDRRGGDRRARFSRSLAGAQSA